MKEIRIKPSVLLVMLLAAIVAAIVAQLPELLRYLKVKAL
jgi:hypothetical protein